MSDASLAESYAKGLLELAQAEGQAYELGKELSMVATTVGGHLQLSQALGDTGLPVGKRLEVVEEIFQGKISALALGFLQIVALTGKAKLIGLIADKYSQGLENILGKALAEVTTAVPLSDKTEQMIVAELQRIIGKKIVLDTRVDPEIIGGIVVRVDGKLLDGSLRSSFQGLRQAMISQGTKG